MQNILLMEQAVHALSILVMKSMYMLVPVIIVNAKSAEIRKQRFSTPEANTFVKHTSPAYDGRTTKDIKEDSMKDHKVTHSEIALAKRALELAMRISTETTTHAWFSYSGHCNIIDAEYSPGGYRSWHDKENKLQSNTERIAFCAAATIENLQNTVNSLEFLYAVAERKDA